MQDFNFTTVYRKGSSLPHVDFLNRNPPANVRRVAYNDWLRIAQKGNVEMQNMVTMLKNASKTPNNMSKKKGCYCIKKLEQMERKYCDGSHLHKIG